jgi:hypothetical protein
MNTSDLAALSLEMTLQQYTAQLHLLNRQGRAYNVGARKFLQRRMQSISDQIASSRVSQGVAAVNPPQR